MSQLRSRGEENILDHQKLGVIECLFHMANVRITHHGILPHRKERFHLTLSKPGEHERNGEANLIGKFGIPGLLELGLIVRNVHRLVPRVHIGKPTHVTGTLDIVLAP